MKGGLKIKKMNKNLKKSLLMFSVLLLCVMPIMAYVETPCSNGECVILGNISASVNIRDGFILIYLKE